MILSCILVCMTSHESTDPVPKDLGELQLFDAPKNCNQRRCFSSPKPVIVTSCWLGTEIGFITFFTLYNNIFIIRLVSVDNEADANKQPEIANNSEANFDTLFTDIGVKGKFLNKLGKFEIKRSHRVKNQLHFER